MALARALAGCETIDVAAALALLNTMPDSVDAAVRDAVEHAKCVVAAAPGGDHRHQAIARYMIARVVVLLERAELAAAPQRAGDAGAPP